MSKPRRRISLFTEPGFLTLAVMIELIRLTGGKEIPVPAKTIAETIGISQSYTEKMLFLLRGAQLVASVKGPRGGYFPAKDPKSISVAAVFEAYYCQSDSNADEPGSSQETANFRERLEDFGYRFLAKVTVADLMSGDFGALFVG
jgi:Rrf2 family protein